MALHSFIRGAFIHPTNITEHQALLWVQEKEQPPLQQSQEVPLPFGCSLDGGQSGDIRKPYHRGLSQADQESREGAGMESATMSSGSHLGKGGIRAEIPEVTLGEQSLQAEGAAWLEMSTWAGGVDPRRARRPPWALGLCSA